MTELERCPYCGNANITGAMHKPVASAEFYEVLCVECGARIRRSSKRKAIEAWNRRMFMSKDYPCIHWNNRKCKKFSDDNITSWCVQGPCDSQTPTNADHIRSMSDEGLAKYLFEIGYDEGWPSAKDALKWLQQPVEIDK